MMDHDLPNTLRIPIALALSLAVSGTLADGEDHRLGWGWLGDDDYWEAEADDALIRRVADATREAYGAAIIGWGRRRVTITPAQIVPGAG